MGREPEAGAQAGQGARVRGGGTWKTLQPDSSPHWGQGLSSPTSLPISQVQQVYPTELPKLCSPNPVLLPPLGVPRVLKNPTFSLGTKSHPNPPLPAQGVSPAFTGPCTSPPPPSPGTSTSFQPCTWTDSCPPFPKSQAGNQGHRLLSLHLHTHTQVPTTPALWSLLRGLPPPAMCPSSPALVSSPSWSLSSCGSSSSGENRQ